MKRYHPLLLFLGLVVATSWTSLRSYQIAEREIHDDLQQALALTRAEEPADWFTTDTIRQFRSHIVSPVLRDDAQLAFLLSADGRLCIRPYVSYSAMQIWRMSDQRLSALLALLVLASMAYSLIRRETGGSPRLTPMQEQLVGLLMSAPERRMSKQDICQALWPGKPDASDTLYTLVRRTKQALEPEGRIRIASERGRSYRIEVL